MCCPIFDVSYYPIVNTPKVLFIFLGARAVD
nr:MAG TPA: hypothetical protein [Caudoviricetes sp.]